MKVDAAELISEDSTIDCLKHLRAVEADRYATIAGLWLETGFSPEADGDALTG